MQRIMGTPDAELIFRDESGDAVEASLSGEQYEWIQCRAEQHDMSTAQFVEHVLARLRRAEAIRECAEQSDTFERATDEFTLLMPDDETTGEANAQRTQSPPNFTDDDRSLFDFSLPNASNRPSE